FIISTLSHPVTWYLVFFFYWLYDVIMARLSISNLPNPIEALQFAIGMSFWSLIIAGWITAPIGILTGIILFYIEKSWVYSKKY
ncbi:hypothetical protein TI05_13510, partial [Achromatium sp. WMS3]